MAVTPRCELSAAVNAAAVPVALTGWTNAGLGVSGTAPATGDFVIIIITSNTASDTLNQTAGTRWTPLDDGGTNLGAATGMTTSILFKIWDGTETAPTFTWTTSTRNSYAVMALAPDAGNQIYSDVWSAIKKDTTAATTHTPNSVTIPAGFTDCVLTLAGAVNSATGSASALTWTASTSYAIPSGASVSNTGTTAQNVYGSAIQYQRSLTGVQAPAAMGIAQSAVTTYAQLQTVAIRQIPLTTAPFQVLQTAYGVNATSVTLAKPTSAGSSALIVIASLANTVATVAPSISAVTLGGSADHFAAAKEVSVLGTTFSLANAYYAGIWVDRDCAAGQTAVAVTAANNASNASCGLIVMEVAGISPSAPVDKTISATGNSAAASSGATATTATAVQFLVGAVSGGAGNNSLSGPGPAGNIGMSLSALLEGGAYSVITAATTATFSAALKSSYCWAAAAVTLLSGNAAHPATLATSASFPAVTVNAGSSVTPAPPSLVGYAETANWNVAGTKSTGSVSWQAGDLIIVLGGDANGPQAIATPTFSGGTFTAVPGAACTAASDCYANAWSCIPASGGSGTITSTGAATVHYGLAAWVWRNHNGIGAVGSSGAVAVTSMLQSLTRTAANSAVVGGIFDWNATAPAGYAWNPTPANDNEHSQDSGQYSVFVADWAGQGAAGTASYGITGLTTAQGKALVFIEVKGVTAAPLATSASFPAAAVSAGSGVTPAVLAASASFAAPVNAGAVVTPPALATSASFPAVTVNVGTNATAAPAVLATSASFAAPAIRADAIVSLTGWSYAASGTPVDGTYFILAQGQVSASGVAAGQVVSDTANPGVLFTITSVSAPFAGFQNVSITPVAATAMNSPDPVTQVIAVPGAARFAAPSVRADQKVTTPVLATSASFPARTITADARITATLLPVSASFAAAANAGSGITTAPLAVTAAFAASSVDLVRPPLLAAAASFAAPSVDPVQPPPLAALASFPALTASAGSAAAPAVLATSASFPAATIQVGSGTIVTPPVLAVAAAFGAPAVSTGSAVPVPALAVSASFAAVTITAVSSAAVTPSALAVSTSFAAPAVSAGSAVPVSLLAAVASFPAFGVSAGGNATASPAVLAASASFPAAGISTGTVVIPASLAATVSFAAPQVNAGTGITVPVLAVAAAFAAPAIRADAIVAQAALAGSVSFPARTLRADEITSPAALAVAASFSAPSLRADQAAAPALLAASASFPAAAANAGAGTTTPVLAVSAAFPALTVRAGSVVTTSLLAATAAFPARTVAAGAGVTLSLLAAQASFAVPSLRADAVVTPPLLAASASFPAPGVSAGGNATAIPPLLAASASFPAPAIGIGSAVTVTALATSASFPAVAVSAGSAVTPALLAVSTSFPARTMRCDQAATPAALAVSAAFTATALHCGETAAPAALAGSAAFAAPSLHTGAVAVLAPLAAAASFGAPSVTAQSGITVTPAVLAAQASFPAPAVSTSAGATVTPAALATSASFPARAVAAGSAVVPAALAVQASFPAPALAAGSRVTPGVLAVFAIFPAPAVSTSTGTTVLPAALLTGTVFPARSIGAGAGAQPAGLILAAVFPAPSASTGSVVTPAALAALAAFPPLAVGRPVFAVIALTASCSMRVHAASGPDIDALWNAYAIAAAEAQAAHDYWMELRIAGAQAGMAGNAYADLWTKDGEAQRLWHDWLMASEHWSRELAQFAQYGSTPPPGEFAVDALDA